jgi:long-subunit fatty acid transport protein
MKRLLFPSLLGAVALLAPGRSLAQDKPVLNTAPIVVPAPAPVVTPAPTPVQPTTPTETTPTTPPPTTPPANNLPTPDVYSPSGFELPEREQKRKALQQHAEQYTKLFIYSGFGLNYGSNYYSDGGAFNFSITPALGYRINDRIAVGPGISYTYTNQTFGKGNPTLNLNSLGYKVFGQVRVIDQFFVHGEYEITNVEYPAVVGNNYVVRNNQIVTEKRRIESPLLGAGYRSQISNRVAADIVLLYNFNDGYGSIYQNPVLRFNFLFNIGH